MHAYPLIQFLLICNQLILLRVAAARSEPLRSHFGLLALIPVPSFPPRMTKRYSHAMRGGAEGDRTLHDSPHCERELASSTDYYTFPYVTLNSTEAAVLKMFAFHRFLYLAIQFPTIAST